jgi:hypothetical protein
MAPPGLHWRQNLKSIEGLHLAIQNGDKKRQVLLSLETLLLRESLYRQFSCF